MEIIDRITLNKATGFKLFHDLQKNVSGEMPKNSKTVIPRKVYFKKC